MDRISIRNMVVHGKHGANPGERDRAQPLHLELDLNIDLSRAAQSDDIADTVNYAEVYEQVRAIVEDRSFQLLERLAGAILDEVLADRRIASASIAIAKPDLLDGATPIVRVTREKPSR